MYEDRLRYLRVAQDRTEREDSSNKSKDEKVFRKASDAAKEDDEHPVIPI
jgi:hypothetical protein